VPFDAGFAYEGPIVSGVGVDGGEWMRGVPCKLLVVDFHLLGSQRRGECESCKRTDHDYSI